MSKEKLNNLIDKVVGKVGPLKMPAYWMNKLLKDIGGWVSKTEGSIASVDSKLDKTKAAIPTKVSQLENDKNFVSALYAPSEEQIFGETVTLKNGVVIKLVAPYQNINLEFSDLEDFFEGWLIFNAPKSGVEFNGNITIQNNITAGGGKFIMHISKIAEDVPALCTMVHIGTCDVSYLKLTLIDGRYTDVVEYYLCSVMNRGIIAWRASSSVIEVSDNSRVLISRYRTVTAGDFIEIIHNNNVDIEGYYGSSTSNSFNMEIVQISNDLTRISFGSSRGRHTLITDWEGTPPTNDSTGTYIHKFIEGVKEINFPGTYQTFIPSTAVYINTNDKYRSSNFIFKDNETLYKNLEIFAYSPSPSKLNVRVGDILGSPSISLPKSMTYIPYQFMRYIQYLIDLVIHPGINSIGDGFLGYSSVKNLYVPSPEIFNCAVSPNLYGLEIVSGVYYFKDDDLSGATKRDTWVANGEVIKVTIEGGNSWNGSDFKNLNKVREGAFASINRLNTISIPETVTEIGTNAFGACYNLTELTILAQLSEIPAQMCSNCSSLINFTSPTVGKKIGDSAFSDCYNLKSINITDGCERIESYAFRNCRELQSINIPQSCTYIRNDAFSGCKPEHITVDEGNTSYDSRNDCNALIKTSDDAILLGGINTIIPDSVTTIKSYAFTSGGIAKLVIPKNVSLIDYRAFYSSSTYPGLDGEIIVNGVPTIGNQAFYNVTPSILQFTSEDGIPALLGPFYYFKEDCKIVVPDSLYDAWITSTNWSTYADQIIKKSDWDAQQTTE